MSLGLDLLGIKDDSYLLIPTFSLWEKVGMSGFYYLADRSITPVIGTRSCWLAKSMQPNALKTYVWLLTIHWPIGQGLSDD